MSHLICKTLHHVRSAITASPCKTNTHNLCSNFLHIHPFSSSLASIETSSEQSSFTVTYLINSCGFPLKKALSASKYINFKSPDKPDSVLAFLENHGFTKTQISKLIRKNPPVLALDPQKNILPKLEFFKSKGVSSAEVTNIFSLAPTLLRRSLETHIIPTFNFLKDVTQSEDKAMTALKRSERIFGSGLRNYVARNVEVLREAGVPNAKIVYLVTNQPAIFMKTPQVFKQTVEEVGGMGFDPLKFSFVLAVNVFTSMSRSTWEKKVEVYKKWGWSEDEILVAFGKDPWCMSASEGKIMAAMDFFVNKMGLESSYLAERPFFIKQSLDRTIVPRCAVYQALLSKRLIKKSKGLTGGLMTMLKCPEKCFLRKFVNCYEEEAPELLKLYMEKVALAK